MRMRQISRIEKLTSGRYRIVLEDETYFPLYAKELAEYGIEEHASLSEEAYEEIMRDLLPKRARMRALYLLQAMGRTEAQLRQKLSSSHYPPEIVNDAVEYVRGYHYIDDVRYAVSYLESRKESRSRRQLELELYRKGISREDLAAAFEQLEWSDEAKQILAWAEKKGFDPQAADRRETERFYRFLLRRGYELSAIRRAFSDKF